MSSALWWVPFAAGLQDGISPCVLINASLILLGLVWLKKTGLKNLWLYFMFLIGSIFLSSFLINCGVIDRLILSKHFVMIVKWIYVVLAVGVMLQGLRCLSQWFCLIKGKELKPGFHLDIKLSSSSVFFLILVVGCILSLLAALWPTNYYISIFSMYMTVPGQFFSMVSLIAIYTFVTLWVVYWMIWVVSLETRNLRLFKIISAAILISASVSIIELFL